VLTKQNKISALFVIIVASLSIASSVALAQGRWENATNVGEESTGDFMLTRCIYETLGGYRFSIISRGICPFSVSVNPETGQVRR
jgi:hypothetical protein